MRIDDLWYKDAVVYCLDVETSYDADGDGVGDFRGLTKKLDYIAGIGATCVWLLPFYPTPNRDNGYDVMDYYGVDPRLGTLGDFVEFVHRARDHGLRVIIDLVVNHTSDQHPWFQAARSDPESPYRDFYVWADEKPEDAAEGVVFPGVQDSTWTYDRKAKAYYFHRFYDHQPDLDIGNPRVREEIKRVMGFWLALGVSGFRIDAAPFLIELKAIDATDTVDPYAYLKEFRGFLQWRQGDAILIAEANVAPEQVPDYVGDGDKLHLLFHFWLNQHLFLALARERAGPLMEGFLRPPRIPPASQWATFLRNHDELDLGRLTEAQRQEAFDAFAPDEGMRLYDRGIRRRLAPMLGDPARVRMALSLLLSLPGTPVFWYGQEIGMGDRLDLPERDPVRTPMQWSAEKNGGFSTAAPEALPRPVVEDGPYAFAKVNVEAQRCDPTSLLAWVEHALRVRKEHPALGRGEWRIVDTRHEAVFAHACEWEDDAVVAVHNLAGAEATASLDLSPWAGCRAVDVLDPGCEVCGIGTGAFALDLPPYGFRWYRLVPS